MSHTSSISAIKIVSVSALRAAVTELASQGIKCSLIENAVPRAYFTNQTGMGKADFVLKLDAAKYDIGLYKQDDGSYEARTDFYGGTVEAVLGGKATNAERTDQAKLGKLFQAYGLHVTMDEARRKGLSCKRVVKEDGTIRLVLTGASL